MGVFCVGCGCAINRGLVYELPNSDYICSDCVDWLVDQVAIVIEGGGLTPAAPDRAEQPQLENYGGKMVLTHPGHNE